MRLVGDIHGQYDKYYDIVRDQEESIQIGDFGFSYRIFKKLGPKHRFIGGNHDNYSIYHLCDNAIGDFGEFHIGDKKCFFVRGAFSIDQQYRRAFRDWWPNEELSYQACIECYDSYLDSISKGGIDIMLTHDAPTFIGRQINNGEVLRGYGYNPETFETTTQILLERLFNTHQPKKWFFGHYHESWSKVIEGCEFRCLNELEYIDI